MDDPDYLILDEPFDALDVKAQKTLRGKIDDFITKKNKVCIFTSHVHEIKEFADEIYLVDDKTLKKQK